MQRRRAKRGGGSIVRVALVGMSLGSIAVGGGCFLGLGDVTYVDTGADANSGGAGGRESVPVGGSGGDPFGSIGGSDGGCPPGAFTDTFDHPSTLTCWDQFAEAAGQGSAVIRNDHLVMTPAMTPQNAWYQDNQGLFLSQPVTGNFLVATFVFVGTVAVPSAPPKGIFSTAGLLARAPRAAPETENWLLIDVGYQDENDPEIGNVGVGIMYKSTMSSATTRTAVASADAEAILGICRVGQDFHLLKLVRDDMGTPDIVTFPRADLPATLDVGPVAGAWVSPHDIAGWFEYVAFVTDGIHSLDDCTRMLAEEIVPE